MSEQDTDLLIHALTHMHAHTDMHTHAFTHAHTHCIFTCAHRQPELGGTFPHEDEGECSDTDSDLSMEQVAVQSKPQWDCESVLSTYSNLYNHPARITEPPSLKGEVGSATASLTFEHTATRGTLLDVYSK